MFGFDTSSPSCTGSSEGQNLIKSYLIAWDVSEWFLGNKSYQMQMFQGDGVPEACCPARKCSLEIGTEVQKVTITIDHNPNGSNMRTAASFRLVYVGAQSFSAVVIPTKGSSEVLIVSYNTHRTVQVDDFIRITSNVYRVHEVNHNIVTLSSIYMGEEVGIECEAYFNAAPIYCYDPFGSSEEMRYHISQNFDNSPFREDVEVSKISSSAEQVDSVSYLVTFTGVSFSSQTEQLFEVSHRFPWFDDYCSSIVEQNSSLLEVDVKIETLMNSTVLEPGRQYYVKVAALNEFGVGPSASSLPKHEKPRSSPGLAQDCKVYAASDSATALQVEWRSVYPYVGEAPSQYRVELYMNATLILTREVTSDETLPAYSTIISGLTPGYSYEVVIVPVSSMGEGGPIWFSDIDVSSGALMDNYRDYLMRSCIAKPTCNVSSDDCVESKPYEIKVRSQPSAPLLNIATYPNYSTRERFTKDSLFISIMDREDDISSIGDSVDKFRIQWSPDPSFSAFDEAIIVQQSYLITSLVMGKTYYVRGQAHNSAGFGAPTGSFPVRPITKPDPPNDTHLFI
jgi:hypothetical protein